MAYTQELHEKFKPLMDKRFFHPHECRIIQDIFTESEGFLTGWWTCQDCVRAWVERLLPKAQEFEKELEKKAKEEIQKQDIPQTESNTTESQESPEEKKDAEIPVKKSKKNGKKKGE